MPHFLDVRDPSETRHVRVMSEPSPPLDGENIETTHWEDARHWMSIYADLLEFKRGLLDRIRQDIAKLPPIARETVALRECIQAVASGALRPIQALGTH
jgi:hypothetical protein